MKKSKHIGFLFNYQKPHLIIDIHKRIKNISSNLFNRCQKLFFQFYEITFADGLVKKCLDYASSLEHIMDFTRLRALGSLFSMINQSVRNVLQYNHSHADFPMPIDQVEKYVSKCLVHAILWSFTGDAKMKVRDMMGDFVRSATTIPLPPSSSLPILDFEVAISGDWMPWSAKVPQMEVETHKVASPDVVVPTLDTVRHEALLYTWLADHKPMGKYIY